MPSRKTPKHVVIAGGSGLIGKALVQSLRTAHCSVTQLVRRAPRFADEKEWLTDSDHLDPDVIAGADAVIGLNGATIGRLRWTAEYQKKLISSRLRATSALANAVSALGDDAPHFLSGSAAGYYGDAPGKDLTEDAPVGDTFLARLCDQWEKTALTAGDNARVTLLRTSLVIAPSGGFLGPLRRLTKLGIAGPIGTGKQVWPWVSLDDTVRAIQHVVEQQVDGPVNIAAPERATSNDIGFALARRLNKPFVIHTPKWGLRLVLSKPAADALLLCDAHVVPEKLKKSGFEFTHPTVADAIRDAVPAAT